MGFIIECGLAPKGAVHPTDLSPYLPRNTKKTKNHIRNASLEKKKDLEEEIERKQREIIVQLCLLNINERSDTILTN